MKLLTYPPFRATCIVNVQLPENKSFNPNISIRLTFFINNQDDVYSYAKREAIWQLERLGVDSAKLKDACFETEDHSYIAVEPRGVKRDYNEPVEAFYFCDPRKRDLLIRQRRLVPESQAEMVALYGKTAVPA